MALSFYLENAYQDEALYTCPGDLVMVTRQIDEWSKARSIRCHAYYLRYLQSARPWLDTALLSFASSCFITLHFAVVCYATNRSIIKCCPDLIYPTDRNTQGASAKATQNCHDAKSSIATTHLSTALYGHRSLSHNRCHAIQDDSCWQQDLAPVPTDRPSP
jgi:hypothetical protein